MKWLALKPTITAKWILATLGLVLASLLLFFHQVVPGGFSINPLHSSSLNDSADNALSNTGNTSEDTLTIPNIVHFVHLVHPSPNPTFEFGFREFIAIYSAWHYLQPETIYIHTNVEEQIIKEILLKSTSPNTKAVAQIPAVKFSHQTPPDHTTSGAAIDKLPNQSDFVRTIVLRELGGIYLDADSYVLRDLSRLRRTGFANVVGRQVNGQICPAVIMSTPRNKLIEAYQALQDSAFDPNFWAHHATDLLTTLAQEFQIPDQGQVLILPQDTFFPFAWFADDLRQIYQVHEEKGLPAVNNKGTQNLTEFYEDFQLYRPNTWRRDWRSSYVLHGWTSGIGNELDDQGRAVMFGGFGGITPEYVLARNSNFARAVYPAVRHALDNGVLDGVKYNQSQP